MNNNLPFDDFVKEHLSNHSADVPDHIWENIIAKRKSRPKGFWVSLTTGKILLFISILILLSGGTYFFITSSHSSHAPIQKNGNDNDVVSKPNPSSQEKINKHDQDENIAENRSGSSTITDENKIITQNSDNTSEKNINEKNNSTTSKSSSSYIKINSSKQFEVISADQTKTQTSLQNSTDIKSAIKENNSKNLVANNPFILNHGIFPVVLNNTRNLNSKNITAQKTLKLPDCPTIEKDAAGNKKYWEVYAGPDHPFSSYKTFGDTASLNYLQKRKASTASSSSFSAGVRYTKVFNNAMSVRTGLNYSQINEKFKYINPSEIRYVTVITTRVIIRSPGDTLFVNDTLQYQVTGTRTKTTYNRYRSVDIPLVVGYEVGNGKFHANINAGVIINIYSWYKGDVLDSSYQPISITTGKNSSVYQFKNNIGVGFLGSVSLYYKLTDQLHLLLEPYFRYNLSPMSKDNLNLQQKYHTAGIRAGIRFDLK